MCILTVGCDSACKIRYIYQILPLGHYPKSLLLIFIHILNVPGLLSIGACICKLSIIVLHAVDRFISRVGTEVTVSVLFSQDHKKC